MISDVVLLSSKQVLTHADHTKKLMNDTSHAYPDIPAYSRLLEDSFTSQPLDLVSPLSHNN